MLSFPIAGRAQKDSAIEGRHGKKIRRAIGRLPVMQSDNSALIRLSEALRYKTLTYADSAEFGGFHRFLRRSFPLTFRQLKDTTLADGSLLLIWPGTEIVNKAILWLSHQDVVPADDSLLWDYPPFAGIVTDSFVHGRGALDMKAGLMGQLEAVEMLLRRGFKPRHTIYLAMGADEEGNGLGARTMAALIARKHKKVEYILDEGGSLLQGIIPGVHSPVAMVAIAEKGYLSLELLANGVGRHSSTPGSDNALDILLAGYYRLKQYEFPEKLIMPVKEMLRALAPEFKGARKFIIGNPVFFSSTLRKELRANPYTRALIHTTTAATLIRGGEADNMQPARASLILNLRIMPGETVASTLNTVKKVVRDNRIIINVLPDAHNPVKPSSPRDRSYQVLKSTIEIQWPGTRVAPGMNIGSSDSRHYTFLTENILRFIPNRLRPGDENRIHGRNERVATRDYLEAIEFYGMFLQASDAQLNRRPLLKFMSESLSNPAASEKEPATDEPDE